MTPNSIKLNAKLCMVQTPLGSKRVRPWPFRILQELVQHGTRTRLELVDALGYDEETEREHPVLKVHMHRLRQSVKDLGLTIVNEIPKKKGSRYTLYTHFEETDHDNKLD